MWLSLLVTIDGVKRSVQVNTDRLTFIYPKTTTEKAGSFLVFGDAKQAECSQSVDDIMAKLSTSEGGPA